MRRAEREDADHVDRGKARRKAHKKKSLLSAGLSSIHASAQTDGPDRDRVFAPDGPELLLLTGLLARVLVLIGH